MSESSSFTQGSMTQLSIEEELAAQLAAMDQDACDSEEQACQEREWCKQEQRALLRQLQEERQWKEEEAVELERQRIQEEERKKKEKEEAERKRAEEEAERERAENEETAKDKGKEWAEDPSSDEEQPVRKQWREVFVKVPRCTGEPGSSWNPMNIEFYEISDDEGSAEVKDQKQRKKKGKGKKKELIKIGDDNLCWRCKEKDLNCKMDLIKGRTACVECCRSHTSCGFMKPMEKVDSGDDPASANVRELVEVAQGICEDLHAIFELLKDIGQEVRRSWEAMEKLSSYAQAFGTVKVREDVRVEWEKEKKREGDHEEEGQEALDKESEELEGDGNVEEGEEEMEVDR